MSIDREWSVLQSNETPNTRYVVPSMREIFGVPLDLAHIHGKVNTATTNCNTFGSHSLSSYCFREKRKEKNLKQQQNNGKNKTKSCVRHFDFPHDR